MPGTMIQLQSKYVKLQTDNDFVLVHLFYFLFNHQKVQFDLFCIITFFPAMHASAFVALNTSTQINNSDKSGKTTHAQRGHATIALIFQLQSNPSEEGTLGH